MKLAFYTCFYGSSNNNAFSIPPLPSAKYDCYYFTNNQTIFERLQSTRWIGVFEPDKKTTEDVLESCMMGKHVKALPHLYKELNNYDYTCFLDSKLAQVNEAFVEDFIQRFFVEGGYALLLRHHWFLGNNVGRISRIHVPREVSQQERRVSQIYRETTFRWILRNHSVPLCLRISYTKYAASCHQ